MDTAQQQLILDKFEIIDIFNRYAIGVDTRNKEVYLSCFTDELLVNLTGENVENTAEGWTEQAFTSLSNFEKTQHIISNHMINIDGDTAEASAYLQAHHFTKDNTFSVWGHYNHKLVRTPEGWRINNLTLVTDWHEFK
jgi:3-phenylpropionate/cinnamic acid dioxygenase small subunit